MDSSGPPNWSKAVLEGLSMPALAASAVRPPLKVDGAGQGEPVIVIPGMMAGDNATSYLRRSLTASGFDARPSGLIFNTGATPRRLGMLEREIERLHGETGQLVTLVGWSLGGLFARLLGQRCSEHLCRVVTLGAPFSGDPHANRAWRLYELLNGHPVTSSPYPEDLRVKPPVDTIAFWSPDDGVISPESARGLPEESDRQVEIGGTHMEMATTAPPVKRIIEVLAQASD